MTDLDTHADPARRAITRRSRGGRHDAARLAAGVLLAVLAPAAGAADDAGTNAETANPLSANAGTTDPAARGAGGSLTYNLALTSDYRFRGVSQTFRGPAPQAGLDWAQPGGWYVGTWASRVSKSMYAGSRGIEWDVYGGYKFPLGGTGLTGDVGLLNYRYPGEGTFDTLEAYAGVGWNWLSARYSHTVSRRYFGADGGRGTGYLDITANYPLAERLNVIAHFGATRGRGDVTDYTDYRLGMTYDLHGYILGASWYRASEPFPATKAAFGTTKNLGAGALVVSVGRTF